MSVGRYGKYWLPAATPCLFREADHGRVTVAESGDAPQTDEKDDILYCRQCLAPVTKVKEGMSVRGNQSHVFTNPEGLVFEIGCFARAPGCVKQGRATPRFSWFPPRAWRIALCRSCASHLGWYYEGGDTSSFYGLIVNRLVQGAD